MPRNYQTCDALGPTTDRGHMTKCTRKKGHVLSKSRYDRKHLDTKNYKSMSTQWEPTEAEIEQAKKEQKEV